MNRAIQFRAWHIAEKVMCKVDTLTDTGAFLVGVKKGKDTYGSKFYIPAPEHGRFCDNDEFHLLQFTGVVDKIGRGIFEGDRVFDPDADADEQELFEVEYCTLMARFDLVGEGDAEWDWADWQVYDNIFEKKYLH